jgi:lysylphosphatidylglycerol synthase-like protein
LLEEKQPAPVAPRRRSARDCLSALVVVALVVAIVVHVSRTQDLESIRRLSLQVLVATGVLQFVSQIFLNVSLLLPLQACVTRLGFWELYLVRTGGLVVGSVMPVAGGLAVRLAYLRSRGLTYLDFAWATSLSNVLALAAAAVVAAGATAALWSMSGRPPAPVLIALATVLAMSAAAVAVFEYLPRLTSHPRFARWRWLSSMSSLRTTRSMAVQVFVLCLVLHLLNFVTFGVLTQALSGAPGDFVSGGLLYALTSPVRMVNITPGNVGVTEWVVAAVGKVLAFNLTTGLIVAVAFRGIALAAQALGAVFGMAWLAVRRTP